MCGNGGLLLRFSQGKIKYKIDVKKEQKMEMDLHWEIFKKQAWALISGHLDWMLRLSFTLNENNKH